MKKIFYLILFCPSLIWADAKVSQLLETTTPTTTDYFYIVANSTSMKVQVGNTLNLPGNSTSYILASSSGDFLTTSSATATYLQLSSATFTYLQNSSATLTYLQLSSATLYYLQGSSATLYYLQGSSAVLTYLQLSSATATYFNKNSNYVSSIATNASTTGGVTAASNVAVTIGVNPSSGTLQGNNFNGASQLVQTNSSSFVPNANIDGSSITKAGILVAGSNVTISYGVGVTTIASTASGGVSVYPATSTVNLAFGASIATATFTGSSFSTSTGTLKSTLGVISVSTYALVSGITYFADGAGSAVVQGSTRAAVIPYDCTISSWSVVADTTGTISVDIKRIIFANYSSFASIVGSGNKPSLTSAQKNAATPASWTSTSLNMGDVVAFVVDSSSTVTWFSVILWVTKL